MPQIPIAPELVVIVAEIIGRVGRACVLEDLALLVRMHGVVPLGEVELGMIEALLVVTLPVAGPVMSSAISILQW